MEKNLIIKCKGSDVANIDELLEYQGNLKDLTETNYKMLRSRIEKAFRHPVQIWIKPDGSKYIMDGHQRLRVLNKMREDGWNIPAIPICEVFADTEAEAAEIVLESVAQYGIVTADGLLDFTQKYELEIEQVKLDFRFADINLDKYFPQQLKDGLTDDDVVPEVTENICKLGDLWQLGNHRLLCGDCTDKANVERLMNGQKADMVFTDPPYGVSYADKNAFLNAQDKGNSIQTEIENDHLDLQGCKDLWAKAFSNISMILNDYSCYYITAPQGGDLYLMMMMMMNENGLPLRHTIIWSKNNHVLGRTDYNYKHEPIIYGWAKRHKFYGGGEQRFSVWNFNKPNANKLHPTMKPVELIVNAVMNSTEKGMAVIDVFGGSGSTLIACEKTNRKCYTMELDEHYCDVIIKRWQDFTGQIAVKL